MLILYVLIRGVKMKTETKTISVSKRGNTRYEKNPFMSTAVGNTKTGTKRLTNQTGDEMMIVNQSTGEIVTASTGFHRVETVDRTRFIKLYIAGVRAFKGLTSAGTKAFELLYIEMQENIGKDYVHMNFIRYKDFLSKTTYIRGIGELLDKGFIAETEEQGKYFTNPDYLFNGDRLAFIKEYRIGVPKQTTQEKLEAAGQQRLPDFEN